MMRFRDSLAWRLPIITWLLTGVFLCTQSVASGAADEEAFFEQRIRPILVNHCYECHGPDEAQGNLRLDRQSGWRQGGESGPAIVPGKPSASLLIRAVSYEDPDLKMPPPDDGQQLSEQQIADLVRWVRDGAVDPRKVNGPVQKPDHENHWAFQPLSSPRTRKNGNLVDQLVERQLRRRRFVTTPSATPQTLIRRMSYDLTGLPPTLEQLQTPADQLDTLVDELLDSPHYGERWARHWLDVARYADAKDGVLMYGDARIRPFAYTYRDYVIRAMNEDKPLAQFVREQLAADQLNLGEGARELAAMGFLTLGRMFDRNGHDVIDDQIDTITRGFLGLTVSCARCHDHKFDPIPTADYYSLYGVLASSEQPIDRPRIGDVGAEAEAHEAELAAHLKSLFETQDAHYQRTLDTARDRTADYLVAAATTEPDISETEVFFLSLLASQLRPQITYRWRQLIADRAHSDDPLFAPWHDLMKNPMLRPASWKERGVDARIIDGLVERNATTPAEVARAYGEIIRSVWSDDRDRRAQIDRIELEVQAVRRGEVSLTDIVGGGDGHGTGTYGAGIHPSSGKPTEGGAGFIELEQVDTFVLVPSNKFIDGIFVPRNMSEQVVSSTGLRADALSSSSGSTWDFFKHGPSNGFTSNKIGDVDFSQPPHSILGIHANKGITFDLAAVRQAHTLDALVFHTMLGNGGARGETVLDVQILIDGKTERKYKDVAGEDAELEIEVELPGTARFLTIVVTEGGKGISHDQAILGDPILRRAPGSALPTAALARLESLRQEQAALRQKIDSAADVGEDPLAALLVSRDGPVWFPKSKIYDYLSRKDKDAYRGMVNQVDAIAVKHKGAADRAMVMIDCETMFDPVIFQRGDPTQHGTPVPRQFLKVISRGEREPFAYGSGRLDLANAIADTSNPLTARVWVNRVWMHHFGEPLVENPSDFGIRTPAPVQRELLDGLAHFFLQSGGRTKQLHRLIMNSETYRRSSQLGDSPRLLAQAEQDPGNQFLWRAHRRRLDLEQMRDTMLVVSGQLDRRMYGRPGLITDSGFHRRTIYTFVERQNVPSVVKNFDFANPDTSTARRVNTTVPQQALFAMNSPFIMDVSAAIAARIEDKIPGQQVGQLYLTILGRTPENDEHELGLQYLQQHSLAQYAHLLLMTNELMFID